MMNFKTLGLAMTIGAAAVIGCDDQQQGQPPANSGPGPTNVGGNPASPGMAMPSADGASTAPLAAPVPGTTGTRPDGAGNATGTQTNAGNTNDTAADGTTMMPPTTGGATTRPMIGSGASTMPTR